VIALIRVHALFLTPRAILLNRWDEGYLNAFARRMVEGSWLPYVDAVSHRGPLLYWSAALGARLWGTENWTGLRVLGLVTSVLTSILAFFAARRAGRTLAGSGAGIGLVVGIVVTMEPMDGLAYNGEHLLNVFAFAALLFVTLALVPGRRIPSPLLVGLSGACVSLAMLSKQVGAVNALPIGLWVAAAAVTREGLTRRQRWAPALAYVAGGVLPFALIAVRYAAAHELGTFYYYFVRYNTELYVGLYTPEDRFNFHRDWYVHHSMLLAIGLPIAGWGLARVLAGAPRVRDVGRAWDERGFEGTVALGAICALAGAHAGMHDFYHYYVQLLPWFGLLAGLLLEGAMIAASPLLQRSLVALAVVIVLHVAVESRWFRRPPGGSDAIWNPPCQYIADHARPDQAIFIWGFRAELYTICKRRPASRYVFSTFPSGVVPWLPASVADEDRRAAPGSREILLAELEETKAPVILDDRKSLMDRPMNRYAIFAQYLTDKYCTGDRMGDFQFYLRRAEGGTCPPGSR
jgi:4-amino-4-deoxy-L-arabinose transferase-like glycosyltransferase